MRSISLTKAYSAWFRPPLWVALLSFSFLSAVAAVAQAQPTGARIENSAEKVATSVEKAPTEDTRYRIGPGDVLTILVSKAPELSLEAVRVDQHGMIRIPMIADPVFAACKSEDELATTIKELYLQYKRNPSVNVFVKEFQSQPVSVIGAVVQPGQFRMQRQVRLLELVSFAGGPSDKAGRVINVIHTGGPNVCKTESDDATNQPLEVFKLDDTLHGKENTNPFMHPGDIISVPEADQVFVVGYVYEPKSIPLKDKVITVSRAVAMAGGPKHEAKTSAVRIVRQVAGNEVKQEIKVDLKAIEKHQALDIALLPNDIVEVPSSTGKMIIGTLTSVIAPTVSQGTVRVIR